MPIYRLSSDLIFPPVSGAEDGVVAVGGDLTPERLILAYREGIFPWYNAGEPIVWWCPDPRFVLFPDQLHVSRSLRRALNKPMFQVTFNRAFEAVISECKLIPRAGQHGTWITDEMELAYIRMHEMGIAESVEVWIGNELVGGIYGMRIGQVFCGESMFSHASNASKIALVHFMQAFKRNGGILFDCQVYSDHMQRMGAMEIPRIDFLTYLHN